MHFYPFLVNSTKKMKINASTGFELLRNYWQALEGILLLGIVVSFSPCLSYLAQRIDGGYRAIFLIFATGSSFGLFRLLLILDRLKIWSLKKRFRTYGKEYWRGKTLARPGFRPWVICFLNLQQKFTAFLHYLTEPAHSCATTALRALLSYVSSLKPFTVESKASMTHC